MLGISYVLLGLLSTSGGEVLRACAQGILYQHPVTPYLLGVKFLLNPPTDFMGCGDMTGLLQDHCLKDDETL